MPYLTSYLPFPTTTPSLPPTNSHLLITSTLQSPGDFAVAHILFSAIQSKKRKVVLVDCQGSKGRKHWESIGRKLGVTITGPKDTGLLEVIAPSSLPSSLSSTNPSSTNPPLFDSNDSPTLHPLFSSITSSLTSPEPPIIILSSLSTLLHIGFSPSEIFKSIRALRSFLRSLENGGVLVSDLQGDHLSLPESSELQADRDLFERLLRLGEGHWWRIEDLKSGRSGVVSGEISSHPLLPRVASIDGIDGKRSGSFVPRSNPLQYKHLDGQGGVEIFAKGTGRGFL